MRAADENGTSPSFEFDPSRRFAVIGAGAAGLCHAKYLLQAGYKDVTIFEIGSNVGGLWCYKNDNGRSAAYRTLHINTAKNLTSFTDLPFDDDIQMFPSHWDMKTYFERYVDTFGLRRLIRFNSRVTSVAPSPNYTKEKPKWLLETGDGFKDEYDRVIVATGHLSVPLHAKELQSFGGEYLHSHDYKEPEPFVGKKVCIVGIGNSAIDIASDVCVTSPRTVLVARSGVMIQPKMIFGFPFTDVTMRLFRWWIPASVRNKVISFLVLLVHGPMTKFGFRPVTKRVHTTSSAVIMQHIAYQRVIVKNEIKEINGREITFSDGTKDTFDVLIGATGYLTDLPFISPEVLTVQDNWLNLYKRIVPPGWFGLYFAGFMNPTIALNLTFEHQARWICGIENGHVRLPMKTAMWDAIRRKKEWTLKVFKQTLRHTMEEDHLIYFRELKVPSSRRRTGGASQVEHPVQAAERV